MIYLYFVLFQGKIVFGKLDVRKKEDWDQVWDQAETFFGGQVQVSWQVNLPIFNFKNGWSLSKLALHIILIFRSKVENDMHRILVLTILIIWLKPKLSKHQIFWSYFNLERRYDHILNNNLLWYWIGFKELAKTILRIKAWQKFIF